MSLPLTEYVRRTTHRQHKGWVAFLEEDINIPQRADYYAMQIALYLIKAFGDKDKVGSMTVTDLKLKFENTANIKPVDPKAQGDYFKSCFVAYAAIATRQLNTSQPLAGDV